MRFVSITALIVSVVASFHFDETSVGYDVRRLEVIDQVVDDSIW